MVLPSMVAHFCNLSTREVEAGRSCGKLKANPSYLVIPCLKTKENVQTEKPMAAAKDTGLSNKASKP